MGPAQAAEGTGLRHLDCERYATCLGEADGVGGGERWSGWTCRGCAWAEGADLVDLETVDTVAWACEYLRACGRDAEADALEAAARRPARRRTGRRRHAGHAPATDRSHSESTPPSGGSDDRPPFLPPDGGFSGAATATTQAGQELGALLHGLRERAGLSIRATGRRLGCAPQAVRAWELGRRVLHRAGLERALRALGARPEDARRAQSRGAGGRRDGPDDAKRRERPADAGGGRGDDVQPHN